MTNRILAAIALAGALIFLVGSIGVAAPADGRSVIARMYRSSGVIAKVEVAFDARDWGLMRFYADEYIGMMKSVTAQVKDLAARGEEAAPAYDTVQQKSVKHIAALKKLHAKPSTKEAKESLVMAIDAGQKAHDAARDAIAKTSGR